MSDFKNPSPTFGADTLSERLSDTASQTAGKVSELGRNAAEGVENAASSLRDAAGRVPGAERVQNFARSASDAISSTADYVRNADMKQMRSDVEQVVKNNPVPALLAAAVVGFVVGRSLTRD